MFYIPNYLTYSRPYIITINDERNLKNTKNLRYFLPDSEFVKFKQNILNI